MAQIGEMWVTIRLGRTPEEQRELQEQMRERVRRRHEEWVRNIARLGYTIEPVEFPRSDE